MKYLIPLLLLLTACTTSNELIGPFETLRVIDGDTLVLNTTEKVRLAGINTPESGECYWDQARSALEEYTQEKTIYLERDYSNRDKYKRLLRYIHQNGENINFLLVEQGYAKVFDKYAEDTKYYQELKALEVQAKEKKKGLWSCENKFKDCLYIGSKHSNTYHKPSCKWVKQIKEENKICYKNEDQVKNLTLSKC